MQQRRRWLAFSCSVLPLVAIAASCREPTQITLRITSGEKCSDLSGVQIVVGKDPAETKSRFDLHYAAALTHDCAPSGSSNLIGTLVLTPGASTGTVVVAAGVPLNGKPAPDPATCADPAIAKSCIIARRSFSFVDHTSLTLPIELDPLCVGKACEPASTCFKGACVDATVSCDGSSCGLPQEGTGGGEADGGKADDGSQPGIDGGGDVNDARTPTDSGDAGMTNGSDAGGLRDGDTPLVGYDPSNAKNACVGPVSVGHHDSCNYMHGTTSFCDGGSSYCCFCICYQASSTDGTVGCKINGGMTGTCAAPCSP